MTAPMLGVDLGGTGGRVALSSGAGSPRRVIEGRGVSLGPDGSDALARVDELLAEAVRAWGLGDEPPRAVGLGIAGLASVVADAGALRALVSGRFGGLPVVIVADGIAAHVGALEGLPGAVVAAGTGAIGLGLDTGAAWRRVDGWGHLLGDEGSGADVGARGLRSALRAHDGRDPVGAALLAAASAHFGPPASWPSAVSAPADRARRLASFVPGIAALAERGDPAARRLLTEAGERLASTAVAALGSDPPTGALVSWSGGLFQVAPVREAYGSALRRAGVVPRPPAGDPLDGALLLAADAAGARRIPLPPAPLSA